MGTEKKPTATTEAAAKEKEAVATTRTAQTPSAAVPPARPKPGDAAAPKQVSQQEEAQRKAAAEAERKAQEEAAKAEAAAAAKKKADEEAQRKAAAATNPAPSAATTAAQELEEPEKEENAAGLEELHHTVKIRAKAQKNLRFDQQALEPNPASAPKKPQIMVGNTPKPLSFSKSAQQKITEFWDKKERKDVYELVNPKSPNRITVKTKGAEQRELLTIEPHKITIQDPTKETFLLALEQAAALYENMELKFFCPKEPQAAYKAAEDAVRAFGQKNPGAKVELLSDPDKFKKHTKAAKQTAEQRVADEQPAAPQPGGGSPGRGG